MSTCRGSSPASNAEVKGQGRGRTHLILSVPSAMAIVSAVPVTKLPTPYVVMEWQLPTAATVTLWSTVLMTAAQPMAPQPASACKRGEACFAHCWCTT